MNTIETLNQRHYRILDLVLQGIPNSAIASALDMSQSQLSIIVNSPSFQHELAIRRTRISEAVDQNVSEHGSRVNETLRLGSLQAAKRLLQLVNSDNEAIARASASDLLDRGGFPKVARTESKSVSAILVLSPEDVQAIKESVLLDAD
jgi:hypothetical protein